MTRKNLDYIITRYADAKEFMLECLQVKLAYLARKMIKRIKVQAEIKRKADLAEKKRIAKEKELERLRIIHEERKQKKRQVRLMLRETIEIAYNQEDERREEIVVKEKKKYANQPNKIKNQSKYDVPLDAVTFALKQEMFDNCYKKINKRISAAKKKAKANKDLKGVSKQNSMMTSVVGSAAKEVTPTGTNNNSTIGGQQSSKLSAALDPHHIQLYMVGNRVKVQKFDKHPDGKKRRTYKDMLSMECGLDVLTKENEKYVQPALSGDNSKRPGSQTSGSNPPSRKAVLSTTIAK